MSQRSESTRTDPSWFVARSGSSAQPARRCRNGVGWSHSAAATTVPSTRCATARTRSSGASAPIRSDPAAVGGPEVGKGKGMATDQYTMSDPAKLYAHIDIKMQRQRSPGLDAKLDNRADLGEETYRG